jgi:hypothetical protein
MLAGTRHWQASHTFKAIPRDERFFMITDWSGAGMDYALGLEKPALYIDVPVKARNDDACSKLEIESFESFIADKNGSTLSADDLDRVGVEIRKLLRNPNASQQNIGEICRKWAFNYGTSAVATATAIQKMLTRAQARCPTMGDST